MSPEFVQALRLARFFGGGLDYWLDVDSITASKCVKTMEAIDASEQLAAINVANFGNMKKQDRAKLHSALVQRASLWLNEKKPIGLKDLARVLGVKRGE